MTPPPRRIRLSRAKGWRLPAKAVNCARPGPLGNPFKVGRDGDRARCVALYRHLVAGSICFTTRAPPAEQIAARRYLLAHREALRGRDLACWCALDGQPCHAAVQLEIVNAGGGRVQDRGGIEMTPDQARIAVPLLNSYAHQYLGLGVDDVLVSGASIGGRWQLIVAVPAGVQWADDFDAAKAAIDTLFDAVAASSDSAPEDE